MIPGNSTTLMQQARRARCALPAFNIAHLPMTRPVIEAVVDEDSLALLEVARIDWEKFGARSPEAVAEEFGRWAAPGQVRLHLDHVPVIDEDGQRVDYRAIIERALLCGYQSVMIDASRLPLDENIAVTREVAELAHSHGVPCEAELGAVLGHEAGPLPPYEELFRTGRGFTDVEEARRFVRESRCDWLSVAIGNIHGAVSAARRDQKKLEARLNLEHLSRLAAAVAVPLVLHGGSGIRVEDVRASFSRGIAKINVGTEIRQVYEATLRTTASESRAQEALYERTRKLIRETYALSGTRSRLFG
jgi:fructose-bisphosphate aldolase class II